MNGFCTIVLKETAHQEAQLLLEPVAVTLNREEYAAILSVLKELEEAGFEVEDFGGGSVLVRAIPMMLDGCDAEAAIQEIAGGLISGRQEIAMDKLDWIYHSTACRAAIKGGGRQPSGRAQGAGRTGSASGRYPLLPPRPSGLF